MSGTPQGGFVGLQALRGLAAMLVVLYHATQMVHERLGAGEVWTFGAAGVDLFFPISGFVMALTTHRHWGSSGRGAEFLWRRLVRVVPLYWAATALKVAGLLLVPAMASHASLDAWHVLASCLFSPAWDVHHRAQPVVPVGWTLHFEMLFYALFAAALALRLQPVLWVGAVLAVFSFLPLEPMLGAIGTLADPILLEFVAGMFIGWATAAGHRLGPALSAGCLLLAFAALPLTQVLPHGAAFTWRVLVWGVPGALAVAAAIGLEPRLQGRLNGWPQRLGDASYAIYLVHGFVLPPLGALVVKLGWTQGLAPALTVLLACLVSAGVGLQVHQRLEQPLTRRLNQRLRWRTAGAARSAGEPG